MQEREPKATAATSAANFGGSFTNMSRMDSGRMDYKAQGTAKESSKVQQKRISDLLENKVPTNGARPSNMKKVLKVTVPHYYSKNKTHYFRIEL
jgi:uncharacterized membrane protein